MYHTHPLAWKQINNSLHQSLHLSALIRHGMVPWGGPQAFHYRGSVPEQNGKAAKNKQHLLIGINNKSERERKTERGQDENENWPQTRAHRMTSHLFIANSITISSMGKVLSTAKCPQLLYQEDHYLQICSEPEHRMELPQHMCLSLGVSGLGRIETRIQHFTCPHMTPMGSLQ